MRHESIDDASIGFTPYDDPPSEGLAGPIQVAHSRQLLLVVVLVVGVGSRSLASCLSSTAYVRSESRTFPLLRA